MTLRSEISVLEALLGKETYFSNMSEEHKKIFLEQKPHFDTRATGLFNIINVQQKIMDVNTLSVVFDVMKQIGRQDFSEKYFTIANEHNNPVKQYREIGSLMEYYKENVAVTGAILDYYRAKLDSTTEAEKKSTGEAAIEDMCTIQSFAKKDYKMFGAMLQLIYNSPFDLDHLIEILKDQKEEWKSQGLKANRIKDELFTYLIKLDTKDHSDGKNSKSTVESWSWSTEHRHLYREW